MKLRIGQPVRATDKAFGELDDIVVDPERNAVSHIIVQPKNNHYQARLVPVSLISESNGTITVNLEADGIRQLERVAFSDYTQISSLVDLGQEWDVGVENILIPHYLANSIDTEWYDTRVGLVFDRIPKGECEIRRLSNVVTQDQVVVGQVDGLISDDDHITAVVVRVEHVGFRRHDVLVPLSAVSRVRNDLIELSIDGNQFSLLPTTEAPRRTDVVIERVAKLQQRAQRLGGTAATRGQTALAKVRERSGRI